MNNIEMNSEMMRMGVGAPKLHHTVSLFEVSVTYICILCRRIR